MTEETLNGYVNKIQLFNMNEDKRFDAVHIKDAVMAGYNICRSECEKADLELAIRIGALEEENTELKADNDARKFAMAMSENVEKQLREENAELKAQLESERDLPAIAYQQGAEKQKKKDEEQLTKAKEIIKKMLYEYQRLCLIKKETIAEAEQFLSEVEK